MKRVTILHTIETGGPGGAESVLLSLAAGIDNARFRSLALLPYEGWLSQQLEAHGIPVITANSNAWYDPRLPIAMARVIRREKVDLVHSHLADQNFYSCVARLITGTKTIVTYHGTPGLPASRSLRGTIKLGVVRKWADATVVVSEYLKRELMSLGFPPHKITRIHNGVDVAKFDASRTGRLRDELGCRNGATLVGMVANLRESKGYEYFIRAARKVADVSPHAKFVAVGHIDKHIGERTKGLVQEMSLQDRFIFLGFRQDIPAVLADLDIFVLSSTSEGFSLATVEAMAAGKPVIATRSGGPEEIIESGTTGLLVPAADPAALASGICDLLADPARASHLGSAGRARAAMAFSLTKMISDYETLYDEVLRES
jgi:glycosyltransferase involved in cell wall biosynthesis